MTVRAMILGAGGMLGRELQRSAPPGADVAAFTRTDLDITATADVTARVQAVRPDVIINVAAFTAVDRAESAPDACYRVNADAVGALGRLAAAQRIPVVHVSTDYVFGGSGTRAYDEHDPTSPINTYGATKLAGEHALVAGTADVLIVRTQWLFGRHGTCFPRTMWERAVAGRPTKVVTDQVGRPTYATDLAAALWELIGLGTRGIVHVTNDGQATWFDVAARVFQRAGRPDLLAPCTTSEYPTAARRPAYSVLSTARFEREVGHPLRPWAAAIDAWLDAVAEPDAHPA